MIDKTRVLVLLALSCGLAISCGETEVNSESAEPASISEDVRSDIYLRFTIDGDGFENETLEPSFATDVRSRNVNYWMAYLDREQTVFRLESDAEDWALDINFKIDAKALGTYGFDPDDLNMNQNFDLNLRHAESEERRQYYAQQATLELSEYDGDYITGTFSGRFFRGSMTNQEDREYVSISDGEFRVNWAEGQSNTNKARW